MWKSKNVTRKMFEAETDEYLNYEKYNPKRDLGGKSRNGYNKKTSRHRAVAFLSLSAKIIIMTPLNINPTNHNLFIYFTNFQ